MASTNSVLHCTSAFLCSLFIFLGAFTSSTSSYSVPPSSASPSSADNSTLSALLRFKASISLDPSGALSSWNTSTHFCEWPGIICATSSTQVKALRLRNYGLNGTLTPHIGNLQGLSQLDLSMNSFYGPVPTQLSNLAASLARLDLSFNHFTGALPASSLGQMKSLQYLFLSHNQLSGPLPSSLGLMKSLQFLCFSMNQLSGPLPSSLGQMKSLQSLALWQNQLSGPLPSSLGQMKSLQHLALSHNQLSGPLPSSLGQMEILDLSYNKLSGPLPPSLYAPHLLFLSVSYNRLQGMIPTSKIYQVLSSDSFLGNPGLCGPPLSTSCPSHSQPHSKRNMKLYALVLVCVVGAISLLASFCAWRHFFNKRDPVSDFVVPHYKAWTAEEMRVATNDFDAANVIGSGAVSMCYQGMMKIPEGTRVVALKRLTVDDYDEGDEEGRESFVNEFKTLCKMRHRNLVKVVGYCVEVGEIALVMEYMENGDLDRQLHNEGNELSWEERVNVALDVAEGLVYLHHEYEQPIIHCDLKPKNILLSSDMVAKISDFGIAKLLEANERGDVSMSKLRGTFGYIAPEYGMGLRISTKVDVYSYGMLLLELVTGVRPTSPMLEEEVMSLRTWAETLLAFGRIRDELRYFDPAILQEAEVLLRLGVQCTHDVAKRRPTMYIVRDTILQLKKQRLQNEHSFLPTIIPHLRSPTSFK